MTQHQGLYEAIVKGDAKSADSLTVIALGSGVEPEDLLNIALIPGMDEIGRRFEAGLCFLPELLIAVRAMKAAMSHIRPRLAASNVKPVGKVVIGTITGDLHDIGKNIVAAMLEGAGFEVIDLGLDVPPERFIDAVRSGGAHLVGMSALLATTMPMMKGVIEALDNAGLRDQVKVMVGGAPMTQKFSDEIGADGYAADARGAVVLARHLIARDS
ncbi:MAG: corrinoid protein [Candidatus Eisenbacteria bacterium]|uniref:Corrinoid protein n=1 Tax=Eiseniibacteriota bacterium TaxID=2212470 RepID=A0A948RYR2_UNCEI|nr:corrinoid protein [Candidatus Eisenbacteria bacterium]MBU1947717.1 corrinoid protein [Candidatus Eisenbacteria bacterium]MBU2692039.1 corrinoid protein [Candidatus Eisenbacteria bacterium]